MWKYFKPNKNAMDDTEELREQFPGYTFIDGKFKGATGVYCVTDLENKEYGKHYDSAEHDGCEFWEPKHPETIKIEDYFVPYDFKMEVSLSTGRKLEIVPALALPKKIFLGTRKKESVKEKIELAECYNQSYDYGKLAYRLFYRFHEDKDLKINDPEIIELINLGVKHSINLPLDLINILIDINESDVPTLFFACMGGDFDFLKKGKKP